MNTSRESTLDDSRSSEASARRAVQPFLFRVMSMDAPESGGARHALARVDEVVFGRGDTFAVERQASAGVRRLTVRLPTDYASATHARLVRGAGTWTLEDTGSRNGSFVNGHRIERSVLREGDVIEIGRTLFVTRTHVAPVDTPEDIDSRVERAPLGLRTLLPWLRHQLASLEAVAQSAVPILLLGETGTGKEVGARAIHERSARPGPLVAVNCGALSPNLVESQLFGHKRGAFSGALSDEPGFLRSAEGGTVLLDEIGDLPIAAQPALLRVLQESEVVPVGSSRPVRVDVRFIAATHMPLEELAATGRFRRDLLSRLQGFTCRLPPLRERSEDIGLIVEAITNRLGVGPGRVRFSHNSAVDLLRHNWPLNIRELEQNIQRALILASGGPIRRSHLPGLNPQRAPAPSDDPPAARHEADVKLRADLLRELQVSHGNVTQVAKSMNKARMQIHRWLRRFEIDPRSFRG